MDARQAAGVLAQLKWLRDQIKLAEDDAKKVLALELKGGERASAIAADGTELGTVTMAQGAKSMQIDNEDGFTAWVALKYPTEIVRTVAPAFVKVCADKVKVLGHLPDANGVPCPHVSLAVGDPKPTTNLSKDAQYLMQAMIEKRLLPDMLTYPELEMKPDTSEVIDGEVLSQSDSTEPEPVLEQEPDLEDELGPPHWRESGTFESSDAVRQRRGTGN